MNIQISHSSMTPIYEQIADCIRTAVREQSLMPEEQLPSVRTLAKEQRISALTVKKAYDLLEEEGLVHTIQGKGSFIAKLSENLILEEQRKQAEAAFQQAVDKAKRMNLSDQEILDLVSILLEKTND